MPPCFSVLPMNSLLLHRELCCNLAVGSGSHAFRWLSFCSLVAAAPDPATLQQNVQQQLEQRQGPEPAAVVKQEGATVPAVHSSDAQRGGNAAAGASGRSSTLGAKNSYSGPAKPPSGPTSALSALNNLGRTGAPPALGALAAGPPGPAGTQLWVEKWRPKVAQDLVGNGTLVGTLRQWLRDWEDVHLHGAQPSGPPSGGSGARYAKEVENLRGWDSNTWQLNT